MIDRVLFVHGVTPGRPWTDAADVFVRAIVKSVERVAIRLFEHRLECVKSAGILQSSEHLAAKAAAWDTIERAEAGCVYVCLSRFFAGHVVGSVEEQLALVFVVARVAFVRCYNLSVLEVNVVGRGAAGCVLIERKGQPGFAVLAVVLEVFESGVLPVFRVPAEVSAVVLTVQGQALLEAALEIVIGSVPTVVSQGTLVGFVALLIRSP